MGCPCRKFTHAQNLNQEICPLPIERLGLDYLPFKYVSLDYLGPVYPASLDAHYVLLFSCMQSRAIYLCLNQNMDTESFLQSLRQMISRNGAPAYILSDHQKCLHAADKILKKLLKKINWNNVKKWGTEQGFSW